MSDEEWFESLGYEVEVTTADGVVWATLRSITRPDFRLQGYGRGNTREDAVASAAARWRTEEIGTDNPRQPGDPLP